MYVAWGLSNGQYSPASLAAKAVSLNFRAVALEYDDFGNNGRWETFASEMRAAGVSPGTWFTVAGNIIQTPLDADFTIAEVEGDYDYWGLRAAIETGVIPKIPRAVCTNFGGIIQKNDDGSTDVPASAARAKPLIDDGWYCHTEVYRVDNPQVTPESMEFIAHNQLGWPSERIYPVFGVWGQKTLADYLEWEDIPGWSVYLAEYL